MKKFSEFSINEAESAFNREEEGNTLEDYLYHILSSHLVLEDDVSYDYDTDGFSIRLIEGDDMNGVYGVYQEGANGETKVFEILTTPTDYLKTGEIFEKGSYNYLIKNNFYLLNDQIAEVAVEKLMVK